MEEATAEDGAPANLRVHARHIKKRALKNKTLSVSFNEKDLKDYVTGFHKRKKKRRKEARQMQEAAARRKRIEMRKQRKLEREFVMNGGAPPVLAAEGYESDEEHKRDQDVEPVASVSGTTMYDNDDMHITVTTSEIVAKEEEYDINRSEAGHPQADEALEKREQKKIPVSRKKQFKKAPKKRYRSKPQSKREKKKGKKKNRSP